MKKPEKNAELVRYEIANFYAQKFNGDYAKAGEEARKLQITDIKVSGNEVEISLARPGLLIGRKGENIDKLSAHLKKKIKVVESFHWDVILTPYDPMDFLD